MDKKQQRAALLLFAWGFGLTCAVTLIAGSTISKFGIVTIVFLGSSVFTLAAYYSGWFKAPFPIGTIPKTVMILVVIWGVMFFLGWKIWPEVSFEPSDRAGLRVVNVDLKVPVPEESVLEAWSKFPPEVFSAMMPKPLATVTVKNVGHYKVIAPYLVRTAVIIEKPLDPNEENSLFGKHLEWQSCVKISLGNDWFPGEPQQFQCSVNAFELTQQTWADILAKRKLFYILTKASYRDKIGPLPISESCSWVSVTRNEPDRNGWCYGHNR